MKPPLTIESFIVYFLFALYIPQVSRGLVFRFFCETCISSFPFQCGKTFAFHRRLCLQLRWLKLLWRRFQAFLWAYGYFMRSQFSGQTSWNFIYFGHLVRIHCNYVHFAPRSKVVGDSSGIKMHGVNYNDGRTYASWHLGSSKSSIETAGTTAQLRPMAAGGRASTESTPEQDWTEIPEGCGSRGRKLWRIPFSKLLEFWVSQLVLSPDWLFHEARICPGGLAAYHEGAKRFCKANKFPASPTILAG